MKKAIYRSFKNLKYEQDKVTEQFYAMLSEKIIICRNKLFIYFDIIILKI